MSWSRTWAISLRIIRQFRRDHRTLALLFIVPPAILSLLGPLIDTTATARVGLSNDDRPVLVPQPPGTETVERRFSDPVVAAIESADNAVVFSLDRRRIDRRLKESRLDGAIIIPSDFSERIAGAKRPELRVALEGSDPQMNQAILAMAQASLAGAAGAGRTPRLDIEYTFGHEGLTTLDFFAPVFIAFFIFFFVFLLTSVSFMRERSQGTIERLMVSPVRRFEVITGYLIGFFTFATIQSVLVLLYTVYVLDAHFAAALWKILFIETLLTIGSVSMGIFLSTFARTELQAVQFIPVVITPQVLLSGMIWPIRAMPDYLQWLAALMPLTYANRALRSLMIKGLPLTDVGPEIAFLSLFALAMMILSAFSVRREKA